MPETHLTVPPSHKEDDMADILDEARAIQRKAAEGEKLWVTLAFIQDMIAEIERLQAELENEQLRGTEFHRED